MPSRTVFWVIPAYNEESSIEDLIDRISEASQGAGWSYRIVVVDDGSRDATGDLSRAKADAGLPIDVLRNEPNQGLGRTIRRGLREAAQRAEKTDVIVTLDADLTQDPIYAPAMVEALDEGYDVAIASRYRQGSGVEGLSTVRRLLSYGASALVSLVRPVRGVRDYSCGFRAYRAEIIQDGFDRYGDDLVSERGFACMLELAERLRDRAAFVEVPFVLRYQEKRKASEIRVLPTIGAYFRVIAKVASCGRKPVMISTLAAAFGSVALGAFGQLMLRAGAKGLAGEGLVETVSHALAEPKVLGGLVLYSLSSVLWLGVLSRMDVSVAYPLGASGYVLVVFLAAFAGEAVTPLRWFGVLLIVMGILLVGWLGIAPKIAPHPAEEEVVTA